MNPDTMNYLVNSLDDAMLDRFISIEVSAEIDDYIDYSLNNEPNDEVLTYLKACPDMLLIVKKAADSTALNKYPTPRGWTKVQEILNRCKLSQELMKEVIAGVVGTQAAASFYGFLRNKDLRIPSTRQLLEQYSSVREEVVSLVNNKQMEILGYIIKKVVISFTLISEHLKSINSFLKDLPEELVILFFKYVSDKRPDDIDTLTESLEVFEGISDRIADLISAE
jgi:hypothetical protein